MVGVLHGLLVAGAIGLIAMAPCLVCLLLISADELCERSWRAFRRAARRLRAVRFGGREGRWWQPHAVLRVQEPLPQPQCPPIEQVAGDLRRLNRLRLGVAQRSPVWFHAVQRAYDEGLRVGCGQLGIAQYLDQVTGIDRAVERLRVEGELQRAGLKLRDAGERQR